MNLTRAPTQTEIDAIGAALWLLQENIALVEWVVCLACTWSPNIPDGEVDEVVQCVVDGILGLGDRRIYVVSTFEKVGSGGGATDLLTNTPPLLGQPPLEMQDGHTGIILPLDEPTAQTAIAAYGGAPGYSECGRMCALMWLATVILHELVHLCRGAGPRVLCGPGTAFPRLPNAGRRGRHRRLLGGPEHVGDLVPVGDGPEVSGAADPRMLSEDLRLLLHDLRSRLGEL